MPSRAARRRIDSPDGPSSSSSSRAAATISCARGLSRSEVVIALFSLDKLTVLATMANGVSLHDVKEHRMQTKSLTPNLTQLTRFHFVNAYLVREDDGFTLVDTTIGKAADELLAVADQPGAKIRRIALTHGHGDHVGALDALRDRLGDSVEVLMPGLDARIHAGQQVVEGKLPGSWPKLRTVPDVRLSPGDRVGSLEVVAAPGHTPGHVAYVDSRDRSLIAGDVFTTYGKAAVTNHFYMRF